MKQGYSLRAIDGFDPRTLSILRNELSVTTAEEFLHAAAAYPDRVARLLGADRGAVDPLRRGSGGCPR
ncbi:MAG TPA: hypothetical protein VFJ82_05145 [Longimicrobium sp.]|nr:hypothetical protein [Longimicrobium sp.]